MTRIGVIELAVLALPAALIVIAITRNRPTTTRFASVNGLELGAATELRVATLLARTRRLRIAGAWAGLALGVLAAVALRLVTGLTSGWTTILSATAGILVGTLVGIAAAQRAPRRDVSAVRQASLVVRDVDAYRTPHGTTTVRAATSIFVVAVVLVLIATTHDVAVTVAATVAVAGGGIAFTIWAHRLSVGIVEMARDIDDPVGAAVDDCLRSCAVRSIQHATVGVLACGIGLLALLGLNTQTYEAVQVGGRTVFQVPDGGHLDEVLSETDVSVRVSRTTAITIHWTDADGDRHTTVRALPPTEYLGSGTYIDNPVVLTLAGLGFTVGWIVGVLEWSAAAKAWRRPAAPRSATVRAARGSTCT